MSENTESQPVNTIPKERLDEVLSQVRDLKNQNQFLAQQTMSLQQMLQQQRAPVQSKPDPELERLREENPALYRRMVKQEQENKAAKAAYFMQNEKLDRIEFLNEHGEKGKKRLAEVEDILNRERQAGNGNVTRAGVFAWLMGQERIRAENQVQAAPQVKAEAPTDAPTTDPSRASGPKHGTAGADFSKLSREDRIKELENQEF